MLSQRAAGQRQVARRVVVQHWTGRCSSVAFCKPSRVGQEVDQPLKLTPPVNRWLPSVSIVGEASRQAAPEFVPAIRTFAAYSSAVMPNSRARKGAVQVKLAGEGKSHLVT